MEKITFIKKSPKIKSYQFETLVSRTFFLAPIWFYTKKSSEKKSSNKWKCMIHNGKQFFFSRFFFSSNLFSLDLIFFRSWDLISWDFIGSPHSILGKKVPGIQWHFFQGLEKIPTFFQSFYFQIFFYGYLIYKKNQTLVLQLSYREIFIFINIPEKDLTGSLINGNKRK